MGQGLFALHIVLVALQRLLLGLEAVAHGLQGGQAAGGDVDGVLTLRLGRQVVLDLVAIGLADEGAAHCAASGAVVEP